MSRYHGGYEFQDKVAVFLVIKEFIKNQSGRIYIEEKNTSLDSDKFDDIKIENNQLIKKIQVKYSKDQTISNQMLSSGDLSLLEHFKTYKSAIENNLSFEFEIITNRDFDMNYFKEDGNDKSNEYSLKKYNLDVNAIIIGEKVNSLFINLKKGLPKDEKTINDFKVFLSLLTFYQVPKNVSFEYNDVGDFEEKILDLLNDKIGIGTFPYQNHNADDTARVIEEQCTKLRIASSSSDNNSNSINIDDLFRKAGLEKINEQIKNIFQIDETEYITRTKSIQKFIELYNNQRIIAVIGEPGVGKSWFVEKLSIYLDAEDIKLLKYNFYVSLEDIDYSNRASFNTFLYNLKWQLINKCKIPYSKFAMTSAVNEDEIVTVLNNYSSNITILLDGLDHISRITDLNELNKVVDFVYRVDNDNIKIVLSSQPIERLRGVKAHLLGNLNDSEIKEYIEIFNLNEYLKEFIEKSKGNFLYLKYLVKACEKATNIKEILNQAFVFNNNIEEYYEYILSNNTYSNEILSLICSSNIPLSCIDILSILNYKKPSIVDDALSNIFYLIKSNLNEEFQIYHESLKRFFVKQHLAENIDVKERYLRPIKNYINSKNSSFYDDRRKYKYLLSLQFEFCEHNDILSHLDQNFISLSISKGFEFSYIRSNYQQFIKAASAIKSMDHILFLSEIKKEMNICERNLETEIDKYVFSLLMITKTNMSVFNDICMDFRSSNGKRIEILRQLIIGTDGYEVDESLIEAEEMNEYYLYNYIINSEKPLESMKKNYKSSNNIPTINKLKYYHMQNESKLVEVNDILINERVKKDQIIGRHILFNNRFTDTFTSCDVHRFGEVLNKDYIRSVDLICLLSNTYNLDLDQLNSLISPLKNSELWKDKFLYVFTLVFNRNTKLDDNYALDILRRLKLKVLYRYKGKPRAVDFYFEEMEIHFLIKKILLSFSNNSDRLRALNIIYSNNDGYIFGIPGLGLDYVINFILQNKWKFAYPLTISKLELLHNNLDTELSEKSYFSMEMLRLLIESDIDLSTDTFLYDYCREISVNIEGMQFGFDCTISTLDLLSKDDDKRAIYKDVIKTGRYIYNMTSDRSANDYEENIFKRFYSDFPKDAVAYLNRKFVDCPHDYNNYGMALHVIQHLFINDDYIKLLMYKSLNSSQTFFVIEDYISLLSKIGDSEIFERDLIAKIYKENNYTMSNQEGISIRNHFLEKANEKYINHKDISEFTLKEMHITRSQSEAFLEKKIARDYDFKQFWRDIEYRKITIEGNESYVKNNIYHIVKEFKMDFLGNRSRDAVLKLGDLGFLSVVDEDDLINFYIKCYVLLKGNRGEGFEYVEFFNKALAINRSRAIDSLFIFLELEFNSHNSVNKHTFNLLKASNIINPEKIYEQFHLIYNFQKHRLDLWNTNSTTLDPELTDIQLLILLLLNKMKSLDKESIINTIDILKYTYDNKLYTEAIEKSLIIFFNEYDYQYPILYRLLADTFYDTLQANKGQINVSKIISSDDFNMKQFFGVSRYKNKPVLNSYAQTDETDFILMIENLDQFNGIPWLCNTSDEYKKIFEFQSYLNKDIVSWNDLNQIQNPKLAKQNHLYYLIQKDLTKGSLKFGFPSFYSLSFYKGTMFNTEEIIMQNRNKFLPLNESIDKYILLEKRIFMYSINRVKLDEEVEILILDYYDNKEYIESIRFELKKNNGISNYLYLDYPKETINTISYKNIYHHLDEEKIEIEIYIYANRNDSTVIGSDKLTYNRYTFNKFMDI